MLILFGGWLVGAGLVLSYMQGIVHPYYTLQLAPPIVALVAIVGTMLWQRRADAAARALLAAMVVVTAVWDVVLLHRMPAWQPWIPYAVLVAAVIAIVWLLVPAGLGGRFGYAGVTAVALAGLLGSGAYAFATVSHAQNGALPSAGPSVTAGGFGRRGLPGGGAFGGGFGGVRTGGGADASLVALLRSAGTTWSAATVGSQSAAPLELRSGTAVMSIGGFSGTDPAPTLARFEAYVRAGEVRYFIAAGRGGFGGNSAIGSWVASTFAATSAGGQTVYDLSEPAS